jgi:Fur family peroxide stress response transcriptional regulator
LIDPESRYQQLVTRLKGRHYRLTPQRTALLRLLAASKGHPSAADLYDQMKAQFPTTSPATVYRTLHLLKEMDEVLELGFSDDDNRYDGHNPSPHPHLICVRCRKIIDPPTAVTESLVREVVDQSGYRIIGHRFDIYGVCPVCQARG